MTIKKNILSTSEVKILLEYFKTRPYSKESYREIDGKNILLTRHKDSEYDQKDSIVYKILHEKLYKILGKHEFDSGTLLESHYPFGLHVDTPQQFDIGSFYSHSTDTLRKNIAVLICLSEDPLFNTVFFNYFTNVFDIPLDIEYVEVPNTKEADLSHLSPLYTKFSKSINIVDVYKWNIGDVFIWPRNQLHCSSNFLKSNKTKNALVLFF